MRYRMWQLWRALTGRLSPADWLFVQASLIPVEYTLFCRMPRYDQRHALDVARVLTRHAPDVDAALIAVALLHDIGKVSDDGRPLSLIWYGIIVVAESWPWLYRILHRYAEPVRRHAVHELRSATLARQAGARPEVCDLLMLLTTAHDDAQLHRFEWADNQC